MKDASEFFAIYLRTARRNWAFHVFSLLSTLAIAWMASGQRIVDVPASLTYSPGAIIRHPVANALDLRITPEAGLSADGALRLVAQLRNSATDTTTPLASSEIEPEGGGPYSISFTAAQMNQTLTAGAAQRDVWLVVYKQEASDSGLEVWWTGSVRLTAHGASLTTASAPVPVTLLTTSAAAATYAPLTLTTSLDDRLDILETGPSSAAQSRQHILDGAGPLEIIPVMRNFSVVGQEKLGLWYSTDDGRTFSDLYPGDLFTAPSGSGGGVRDPSLLIRSDAWYVAYTSGNFGYSSSWGLAKSTNRGRTWTYVKNVEVADSVSAATSGTGAATWGPSWFVDPATGKTHIIISISTGGGNHVAYIQTATSANLENWTDGDPISGDPLTSSVSHVYWDVRVTYAGGYYYLVTCYDATSLRIYRASAVGGPYTLYKEPAPFTDLATPIEQCQLHYLGAGRWRLNYTRVADYELFMAESHDHLETWQTPVKVLDYDPSGPVPHQFSELVRIRSRISDPLPVNNTAAAAGTLTGSTLAGNVTASSLQSLGTLTGTVPGTATGTSAALGIHVGSLAGTPRVVWGTGSNNQTWALDNSAGTLRWINQDAVKMSLTPAGVIAPTIPEKADDAAADADATIPSGGLYRVTGSRAVYRKP